MYHPLTTPLHYKKGQGNRKLMEEIRLPIFGHPLGRKINMRFLSSILDLDK